MGKIVFKCQKEGCDYKYTLKTKSVHGRDEVPCLCPEHGGDDHGKRESGADRPHYRRDRKDSS